MGNYFLNRIWEKLGLTATQECTPSRESTPSPESMASTASHAHPEPTASVVRTKSQSTAPLDGRDSAPDSPLRRRPARAASKVMHAQKEPPLLTHADQELTHPLDQLPVRSAQADGTAQEERAPRESAQPDTSPSPQVSLTVMHAPPDTCASMTLTSHSWLWRRAMRVSIRMNRPRLHARHAPRDTSAQPAPSPVPTAQLASTSMVSATTTATDHALTAQEVTPALLVRDSPPLARRVPTHQSEKSRASLAQSATSAQKPPRTQFHALTQPSALRPARRRTRKSDSRRQANVI